MPTSEDEPRARAARFGLGFKAVRVTTLDEKGRPLKHASGFLRQEEGRLFLYTCWHVVTGYSFLDLKIVNPPLVTQLRISCQGFRQEGFFQITGGRNDIDVPLYDKIEGRRVPRWLQERTHIEHGDLNAISIHVPYFMDAVKVELPASTVASPHQIVDCPVFTGNLSPGDKVYIVGYPYGFSALGDGQPTPIVLTRWVASHIWDGNAMCHLLDSPGAACMSGAPVILEMGGDLFIAGIYGGLVYPDHARPGDEREQTTALGLIYNVQSPLTPGIGFVSYDSPEMEAVKVAPQGFGSLRRGVRISYASP